MDVNIPHCQDAILARAEGKTLDELDESDRDDLISADTNASNSVAELHCQAEGCSKIQFAAIVGGNILALTGRFKPEHYPCKNGDC